MLESNIMYVEDENGKEKEMEILFTFDNEAKNKSYVVFQDASGENDEVFASCYDDDGNLTPIETEEEWNMVEEVLGAFMEGNEDEGTDETE